MQRCSPRRSIVPGAALHTAITAPAVDPGKASSRWCRAELLGVPDALQIESLGQDHGGGHHRARKGPPPGLVHARDANEALRTKAPLVAVEIQGQWIHPMREGGHTMANAFPITLTIGT